MTLTNPDLGLDACNQSPLDGHGHYEPSVTSSVSSSQASVFSDSASTQSSIASSISDDFRHTQEEARDRACAQGWIPSQAKTLQYQQCPLSASCVPAPTYADITSSDQRHHPRRSSLTRYPKPPPLVRQCERKINFVDNLVDSATQMVEVIWPLSVVPCRSEGGSGRGVLPLRTYIEETLRRSRTSYSTLQVALYYLILIKPFVPKSDFTQEQQSDCPADRSLMCGRRMFLAALILASKYLQDRNYSAKAWSKMSGLKAPEINSNERTFLDKVNWKLHIAEPIFKRWTEIVLRYTPNMHPPSPGQCFAIPTWQSIVLLLTPELDTVYLPAEGPKIPALQCSANFSFAIPTTPTPPPCALNPMSIGSTSHESTPTPLTVLPRFLEPKPDLAPPTPALARMGPLPTPQMTPASTASYTPAVSACGSRRPSICSAMALVQKVGFNRCAIDTYPGAMYPPLRRPSITSAASSRSSPESMISDRSRSSRASSISSISTVSTNSSMALSRACLARQATCRNVRLPPLAPTGASHENCEGTAAKPIVIADDMEISTSPETFDFTISEKVLLRPHRHSKHDHHVYAPVATAQKGRKRGRSYGTSRQTDLQDEIRFQLADDLHDAMDLDRHDAVSPSPAADYTRRLLARSASAVHAAKEAQPPASLSRNNSCRMPVQHDAGKKRTCCSTSAMSVSPSPAALYGEVV